MNSLKRQTILGFIWRFLQNVGTQVISFIVSLVLARLLMPSDYGLIAMITVFTSIAGVFISTGFSSSVIQKKDLSETDLNTIFHSGIISSIILYIILFFAATSIASFYKEPHLISLLRVQSLSLIISAVYSTHQALLVRKMQFKKSFVATLSGVFIQGLIGILLACKGLGPWALVLSQIANGIVCAFVMWFIVKWTPRLQFSIFSFKQVFSFSFKILCVSLVHTIFQNIQALIIGKQYTGSDLAYYNKGSQFPYLIMQQVDGSMNTVLFSSLSKYQDDWDSGLRLLRHSMRTSLFVCMPLMIGLCAAAEPLILFLLTDKWIDSVPYVRIVSIICLFWPLSAQKSALNALGKSGITLSMNICSNVLTILLILLTYKVSVIIMIASSIVSSSIFLMIGAFVYRKNLNYRIRDQILDIAPTFVISIIMGTVIYSITYLQLLPFITLTTQVILGIFVYLLLSHIFQLTGYKYLVSLVRPYINRKLHKV